MTPPLSACSAAAGCSSCERPPARGAGARSAAGACSVTGGSQHGQRNAHKVVTRERVIIFTTARLASEAFSLSDWSS